MKKHSTGALTDDQRKAQQQRYETRVSEAVEYDYLFIGAGNAALTCASLLANKGYRILMLEAHDLPGGYAHTFRMGGYHFCAQVHYIWGCGKGGRIYEFLRHLGLENDITFELFDPHGYDHMIMPDGKRVTIPYGWDKLRQHIIDVYPESTGLDAFFDLARALRKEMAALPRKIRWWDILLRGWLFFPNMMRFRHATVQDLFDHCGVSIEAQTILTAQAGDLLLPPNRLSCLFFIGLLGGYGTGAYSPTKFFRYYVHRLVRFVEDFGGDVYVEEAVKEIRVSGREITGVTTVTGKMFTAENYICNMDPQAAAALIGWEYFPERYQKKLKYDYSDNGIVVYLGLKPGFEPENYDIGNYNTWHCLDWGMNTMWEACDRLDLEHAWFFMSTPTLHTAESGMAPEGGHTLEIATYLPYAPFKEAVDRSYAEYHRLKMGLANRLIDLVVKYHIPDLRGHIQVKVVGSPITSEDFVAAPFGNAYGSAMTPANTTSRLTAETPFKNLYWCNASSGSPGIYGTVMTGTDLYMDLTGDFFYRGSQALSEDEMIAALPNPSQ